MNSMNLFLFGELFFSESPRYHWWTKSSPCCYGTYHMSHHLQFLMTTSWPHGNTIPIILMGFCFLPQLSSNEILQTSPNSLTNESLRLLAEPPNPVVLWSAGQTCWPCRSVMDHPCWPQSRQLPVMACHRNMADWRMGGAVWQMVFRNPP